MSAPVASRLFQQLRNPDDVRTSREAELLGLLTQGLSNRELGQQLFISDATVKTHLAHIYAKLGVETAPQPSPLPLPSAGKVCARRLTNQSPALTRVG